MAAPVSGRGRRAVVLDASGRKARERRRVDALSPDSTALAGVYQYSWIQRARKNLRKGIFALTYLLGYAILANRPRP